MPDVTPQAASQAISRLQTLGIRDLNEVPLGVLETLSKMSDAEIQALAKVQQELSVTPQGDTGSIIF